MALCSLPGFGPSSRKIQTQRDLVSTSTTITSTIAVLGMKELQGDLLHPEPEGSLQWRSQHPHQRRFGRWILQQDHLTVPNEFFSRTMQNAQ